jgi:uncharacterized protein (TIGR02646 family)
VRYIHKGLEPACLTTERARILATPDVGASAYASLPSDAKNTAVQQCLAEQGYLCAYTSVRITDGRSHIEHMYPQSHCTPDEQLSYWNIVACFPGPGESDPGYGALPKGDWPTESERPLFVRPTDPSCESRFTYNNSGHMVPADLNDGAAKMTIGRLRLDDASLVANRREAFSALLRLQSVRHIKRRLRMLDNPTDGRLEEYVSAKKQYLQRILKISNNRPRT